MECNELCGTGFINKEEMHEHVFLYKESQTACLPKHCLYYQIHPYRNSEKQKLELSNNFEKNQVFTPPSTLVRLSPNSANSIFHLLPIYVEQH